MQARFSDENSFYPSVCQTCDLWQNERKLCPHSYTKWKTIYPSFVIRRMVINRRLVGATPSTWNFGSTGPRWSEIADFEPIFARSASAVTPSEKSSINTNRKSTTCFPMSLRWSSCIAPKPPKGAQKRSVRNLNNKLQQLRNSTR